MIKRIVLKIYGEVHGVSFRYYTQQKARSLNLIGWVRNEPDGTVKIMAEGEEKNLKKLVDWCYNGVRFAKVDKVEVKWEEASGEFKEFEIKYD
jgi:acylphosphatase